MTLENESVIKNISTNSFLCAWKQGVLAVGPRYFGMCNAADVEGAMDKWRKSMLIAMVGFYNDAWALSLQN